MSLLTQSEQTLVQTFPAFTGKLLMVQVSRCKPQITIIIIIITIILIIIIRMIMFMVLSS